MCARACVRDRPPGDVEDRGGHFAALEELAMVIVGLRDFLCLLRSSTSSGLSAVGGSSIPTGPGGR